MNLDHRGQKVKSSETIQSKIRKAISRNDRLRWPAVPLQKSEFWVDARCIRAKVINDGMQMQKNNDNGKAPTCILCNQTNTGIRFSCMHINALNNELEQSANHMGGYSCFHVAFDFSDF